MQTFFKSEKPREFLVESITQLSNIPKNVDILSLEIDTSLSTNEEVEQIISVMKRYGDKIDSISLSLKTNSEIIEQLAAVIKNLPNLRILTLHDLDAKGAESMAEAINGKSKLYTFMVSGNIGDAGLKAMDLKLTNPTFVEFGVECAHLTTEGCTTIASILKRTPKLETLFLNGNNIGSKGAQILADAFSDLGHLSCVALRQTNINKDDAWAIVAALESGSEKIDLDLTYNNIPPSELKQIETRLKILAQKDQQDKISTFNKR